VTNWKDECTTIGILGDVVHAEVSLKGQDPTGKVEHGHLRIRSRLAFAWALDSEILSDPYELFEPRLWLFPYGVDEPACQLIGNGSGTIKGSSDTAECYSDTAIHISDTGRDDKEPMGDTSSTTDSQTNSRVVEVCLLPLAVVSDEDSDEDIDPIDGVELQDLDDMEVKGLILRRRSPTSTDFVRCGMFEFPDYKAQDLWRSCDAFDASRALSAGGFADLVPELTPAGERVLEYNAETRKYELVEQVPRYTVTIR
jgi:hypothetical protein